jgi:Mn-dependent DtxR family transcriptional regulator
VANDVPDQYEVVSRVRELSQVPAERGPDDDHVWAGVQGFVAQFDYWYVRVMREAVSGYRSLIIERTNPFIRRMELRGMSPEDVAARLVEDYEQRNFVTAGGWALEEMAIAASPDAHKSAARGIDMERIEDGDHHLYVLKSGPVTRNSDIINALKQHSKQAEKLLRQQRQGGEVKAKYAVMSGKGTTTFHDSVWRLSSEDFWSEALGLEAEEAVELAMAMASVASALVLRDVSEYVHGLGVLVAEYIRDPDNPEQVDWEFIKTRTLRNKEHWAKEDKRRHAAAVAALEDHPYKPPYTPEEAIEQAQT